MKGIFKDFLQMVRSDTETLPLPYCFAFPPEYVFGFSCPGLLKNPEILFCGKNGIFLSHNFRAGAAEVEIQNQSILEQLQEYSLAQEILKILKNI